VRQECRSSSTPNSTSLLKRRSFSGEEGKGDGDEDRPALIAKIGRKLRNIGELLPRGCSSHNTESAIVTLTKIKDELTSLYHQVRDECVSSSGGVQRNSNKRQRILGSGQAVNATST